MPPSEAPCLALRRPPELPLGVFKANHGLQEGGAGRSTSRLIGARPWVDRCHDAGDRHASALPARLYRPQQQRAGSPCQRAHLKGEGLQARQGEEEGALELNLLTKRQLGNACCHRVSS